MIVSGWGITMSRPLADDAPRKTPQPACGELDLLSPIDAGKPCLPGAGPHRGRITFMENAPTSGRWAMSNIEREFSLSKRGAADLRATLADPSSPLSQRLAALGVTYMRPKAMAEGSRQTSSSVQSSRWLRKRSTSHNLRGSFG